MSCGITFRIRSEQALEMIMNIRFVKLFVLMGGTLLLESCLTSGDKSPSPVIIPLSVGNYWEYVDSTYSSTGAFIKADTSRLAIRGDTTIQYQGQGVHVFYWHWTTSPDADWLVRNDGDGLYFYGGRTSKGVFLLGKSLNEKFPASAGDSWQKPEYIYQTGDSAFSVPDTVTVQCVATDSMFATGAGVFKNYVYTYSRKTVLTPAVTELYYAPNKGFIGSIARTNGVVTFKKTLRSYVAK